MSMESDETREIIEAHAEVAFHTATILLDPWDRIIVVGLHAIQRPGCRVCKALSEETKKES